MKRLFIFFTLIIAAFSCSDSEITDAVVAPCQHRLFFSEFITDELALRQLSNRSKPSFLIGIRYDYDAYLKYLSDNGLDDGETISTNPLYDSLNDFSQEKLSGANSIALKNDPSVRYSTTYVSDKVTITSDHSFFGETPGEDISGHFIMTNVWPGSEPNYDFYSPFSLLASDNYSLVYPRGETKPEQVSVFFYKGHVLMLQNDIYRDGKSTLSYSSSYAITMNDTPLTQCKEATITLSIPVKESLFRDAFDLSGNYDENKVMHRERTLTGSCTISFE